MASHPTSGVNAGTRPLLFTNVQIFDGSGRALFPGEVRVAGNRIDRVAQGGERIARSDADVIDGGGMTLMPGLALLWQKLNFEIHKSRLS